MEYLIAVQRWIYQSISADISAFAATRDWAALASVLPLGIVFGAVHAMTPGHGKSVLASYLVGSRLAAMRSIAVAAVLALTHVGLAVVLAILAAPLVTRTLGSGAGRAPALEILSWGLLVVIGLWLLVRAFRGRPHVHHEGLAIGVVGGLIPCPLTLFVMLYALAHGVPQIGVAFACAMLIGIALTLSGVALASVLARVGLVYFLNRHGASVAKVARGLDGLSALVLVCIGAIELLHLLNTRSPPVFGALDHAIR
jgi:nickel/cobalt transporter (NicO) family protein